MNEQLELFPTNGHSGYRDWELENEDESTTVHDSPRRVVELFCVSSTTPVNPPVVELCPGKVTTYSKKGKFYYRFEYRQGTKVKTVHIRGGCVGSPTAERNVDLIQMALALGASREEILALISKAERKPKSKTNTGRVRGGK